jgi:pimeloyl-ACP methyl ester carboxylesterase
MGPTYRTIETSRMRHRVLEQGEGPPVILLHGFPEGAYSWRLQVPELARAGFHAIAPDQRGYAGAEVITPVDGFDHVELALDVMALLDARGIERAALVAHDWGAALAWNTALLHPDRITSVVALSVPYGGRSNAAPIPTLKRRMGDVFFYMLYFQKPGVAEAELEADVGESLRRFFYSASGEARDGFLVPHPKTAKLLETLKAPEGLPKWLSAEDLEHYTESFRASGFAGSLGWYRSMDRTWERTAPLAGVKVSQPALFIAGDRDPVVMFSGPAMERMATMVPRLAGTKMLEGVGHWTQQERPEEVSAEIIRFLKTV